MRIYKSYYFNLWDRVLDNEVVTEPGEDLHKAGCKSLVAVLKGTHEIKKAALLEHHLCDMGVPLSHQVRVGPHHVANHCFLTRLMRHCHAKNSQ